MYSLSQFQNLLKPITQQGQFQPHVQRHDADKYQKSEKTHDLLVHLLFAQFSQSTSLRVLVQRFNAHANHHYHLNVRDIRRSTLADALATRTTAPFMDFVRTLCAHHARQIRKDSHDILTLLDSTSIALNPDIFRFAHSNSHNCGIKLHLLSDAKTQLPLYVDLTPSTVNDIKNAQTMPLHAGYHYVFDRGYCDYRWWQEIDAQNATFTTRLRKGARYQIVAEQPCDPAHPHLRKDQHIRLEQVPEMRLRRIEIAREGRQPLIIVSNRLHDSAQMLGEAYQARWGIELLFKWVKQHLNLKKFLGHSENAVKLQILSALIAWFLLNTYRKAHAIGESLHLLFMQLSTSLFMRLETDYTRYRKRRRRTEERMQKQSTLPGVI